MGQQQILLIVLALIIVSIAVYMGIILFRQQAINSKRDLLITENNSLAELAIKYYKQAKILGGGGNSFVGWTVPTQMLNTANGTHHQIDVSIDSVVILGTGNEVITGTDSVKAETIVYPNSMRTVVIN